MSKLDKKIDELLKLVETKKEEVNQLKKQIDSSWKTKCVVEGIITPFKNSTYNIRIMNEDHIIRTTAALVQLDEYTNKAHEILGLDNSHVYDGYPLSDWIQDLKKRLAMIRIKDKEESLQKLEARLKMIMSEDQKRQAEYEAILSELS